MPLNGYIWPPFSILGISSAQHDIRAAIQVAPIIFGKLPEVTACFHGVRDPCLDLLISQFLTTLLKQIEPPEPKREYHMDPCQKPPSIYGFLFAASRCHGKCRD
jgi:hypothetical protein